MATPDKTRPAGRSAAQPSQQRPMGAPVINAPTLPSMEPVGEVKTVVGSTALPLMGRGASAGNLVGDRMIELHRIGELPPSSATGPQKPKEAQAGTAQSEGYVRLELHVENGRLSRVRKNAGGWSKLWST